MYSTSFVVLIDISITALHPQIAYNLPQDDGEKNIYETVFNF